jgi:PAS domain-containing protein
VGADLRTFVTSECQAQLAPLLQKWQSTRNQAEVTLQVAGDRRVPAYVTINRLHAGQEGTLCMIVTDLTEQKRYEELTANEGLSRSILDQAVDAIVVCDDTGKVIRASKTALALCHQNPLLQPFEQVFPLNYSDRHPSDPVMIDVVLKGQTVTGAEVCMNSRANPRLCLLLSAGPLRNRTQGIIGCVVTLTDISRRKQAETKLLEKVSDLEEFEKAVIGRELKMIGLEQEIERLKVKCRGALLSSEDLPT